MRSYPRLPGSVRRLSVAWSQGRWAQPIVLLRSEVRFVPAGFSMPLRNDRTRPSRPQYAIVNRITLKIPRPHLCKTKVDL